MADKRKPSPFKQIRKEGGSRVMSVGAYIPDDWTIVKIDKVKSFKDGSITIKISKVA